MPKSKRNREIPLTKTKSKGLQQKRSLVDEVRKCIQEYKFIYIFEVENPRNNLIKDIREEWKSDSKFFFGKNNVLQIALGRTVEEEQAPGLSSLSEKLQGQRAILMTNRRRDETLEYFRNRKVIEYARSGFQCKETVSLDAGPLPQFSHAIEPHLRQLGLPTSLVKGVVTLIKDHTVCQEGDILTPEQCRILKLLEMPMASFQFKLKFLWTRKTGKVKKLGRTKSSHTETSKDTEMETAD